MIAVFDTAIPGRDYFSLKMKDMKGIISCIAFSPVAHQIMAAGTYSKALGTALGIRFHNPFKIC